MPKDLTGAFMSHRASKPKGSDLPHHVQDEGQLTFAASGTVQMHTDEGVWLVPPQLVAWETGGIPHRLDILTDAELWIILWRKEAIRDWPPSYPGRAFVSQVTPFLHALFDEAVSVDPGSKKAELMVRLALHELTVLQDAPTFFRWRKVPWADGSQTSPWQTIAMRWRSPYWHPAPRPGSGPPAGSFRLRPE